MAIFSAVGQSQAPEGREAGALAAHQALKRLDAVPAALGWVIASHVHSLPAVLEGVAARTGSVPLLGFSACGELTAAGQSLRSVVVALLGGDGLQASAGPLSDRRLGMEAGGILFLVGDGFGGNALRLETALPEGVYTLAGCLSGGEFSNGAPGDPPRGRSFQVGSGHSDAYGLAGVRVAGKVSAGVSVGHGWQPAGPYFKITRVRSPYIQSLDGLAAAEAYSGLFGFPARAWASPPLNTLARLYPLGIERDGEPLSVRALLRVEPDGSFRMNAPVAEGAAGHLLVGSAAACLQAARQAAGRAREALGSARPILALLLADVAWKMLLEDRPGAEIEAVREVIGPEVPIAGGYTFGQVARSSISGLPELLNQHLEVVLIGEGY
jgi:hypothetical protein